MFNLLSSCSRDWTLPLSRVVICLFDTCNLIFSSINLENGLKKHAWNVARIKHGFAELVVILFTTKLTNSYVMVLL